MKAAALAFVLLIGAAIVLAFANTLNSWVLGGLIGGLAALLLSIPISLALFTVMAEFDSGNVVANPNFRVGAQERRLAGGNLQLDVPQHLFGRARGDDTTHNL